MRGLSPREKYYKYLLKMGIIPSLAMEMTLRKHPDSQNYHAYYPLIWCGEPKEMGTQITGMWYVTEYQITRGYEPVIEGGYPYSEADWSEIHQFNRRKDAVCYMRKMRKQLQKAVSNGLYESYSETVNKMWCVAYDDDSEMSGVFYQLERKPCCSVSHYEGYC